MVTLTDIQTFADRVVREFRPDRIILFGSHAEGTAGDESDVDLLVVLPFDEWPGRMATRILLRTDPRFPVDLLARTPAQLAARLRGGDSFLQDVVTRGKVLYEA